MDRLSIRCITILLGLFLPAFVQAAETPTLRFKVPTGLLPVDTVVPVDVVLDSAGYAINALELNLNVPTKGFEVTRVARENSIFQLWPEVPTVGSDGAVSAVAGRPSGIISAGGNVMTLYLRPRASGTWTLLAGAATRLTLHDGDGTTLATTITPATLSVTDTLIEGLALTSSSHPRPDFWSKIGTIDVAWVPQPNTVYSYTLNRDTEIMPDQTPELNANTAHYDNLADGRYVFSIISRTGSDNWTTPTRRIFLIDGTAPEPFTLTVVPGTQVDGRELIAWNAVDRVSGIASERIEIQGRDGGAATSPLTVQSNWKGKPITIIVADAAGNTRSASLAATGQPASRLWVWILAAAVALASVFLAVRMLGHRRT